MTNTPTTEATPATLSGRIALHFTGGGGGSRCNESERFTPNALLLDVARL